MAQHTSVSAETEGDRLIVLLTNDSADEKTVEYVTYAVAQLVVTDDDAPRTLLHAGIARTLMRLVRKYVKIDATTISILKAVGTLLMKGGEQAALELMRPDCSQMYLGDAEETGETVDAGADHNDSVMLREPSTAATLALVVKRGNAEAREATHTSFKDCDLCGIRWERWWWWQRWQ